MTTEIAAAMAIWGAWEALKVSGAAQSIMARLLGSRSALSDDESQDLAQHFESCRRCHSDQDRQVELLQKISDATIEIKTFMLRPR